MLVMLPDPPISFFAKACWAKLYTLTWFCVATKRKGLRGWNSTRITRPLFFLKGFCVVCLDSWCTNTAWVLPAQSHKQYILTYTHVQAGALSMQQSQVTADQHEAGEWQGEGQYRAGK